MKERLQQLIEYLQVNVSQFEKNISVSNGTIRNAMARNKGLNSDVLCKILDVYPNINPDWLLLEKGEMLRSSASNNSSDVGIAIKIISEKDARIESLIRENERLLSRISFLEEKAGLSSAMTKEAVLSE